MSNFLGFESYLVALGASIEETKNTFKAALTSRTWQVIGESVQATSVVSSAGWTNAVNAHDGLLSTTAYCTTSALPQYLGVQCATGFTPTKLHLHGDPANVTYNPKDFTVDWSDDNATWTTLQTFSSETNWTLSEKRIYTLSGAASHPYWRLRITAANGGATTSFSNLIFEDATGRRITNGTYYLELIPPTTETIGNAKAYEFLRMGFTSSTITFLGLVRYKKGFPQCIDITYPTAGAVTCSVTVNGQTVSYTGIASNSVYDNLDGLYAALRDSSNSEFLLWDWSMSYPAPQNWNDATRHIIGEAKSVGRAKTVTGTACTVATSTVAVDGWEQDVEVANVASSVTTDLVSGFVYYLQVHSRGIALATKTNANYYGPIHACWQDNAAAIAYMPTDANYCSPIELVWGVDDDANNCDSYAWVSHLWSLHNTHACLNYKTNYSFSMPNGVRRRHRFADALDTAYGFTQSFGGGAQMKGSGLFVDDQSTGNDFQIHRAKTCGVTSWQLGASWGASSGVYPGFEISDWYKFRGTATNESLLLIADTVTKTVLASNYTPGDTTLSFVDASSFPSAGFVVIGVESFQYTGKSGNQLTGVTGAKYGSTAARHFAGDSANLGLWLVVINGGALFAGYSKPS